MKKPIFPKEIIYEIIAENRYKFTEDLKLGAKEYHLLQKTASDYGFDIVEKKLPEFFENSENIDSNSMKKEFSGAVLHIDGEYSVHPEGMVQFEGRDVPYNLYIFQNTLQNVLNKMMSKLLIEKELVTLFEGCDEEYLYEAFSETIDQEFYETTKARAKGLPIYKVSFKENGGFKITEMGEVPNFDIL